MKIPPLLSKLESLKPFTEQEAWNLFRFAALSEAVGWTVLLLGISIDHFGLPGHRFAVPIAGQIHGTIFLLYFGVQIAVYSSLGWSRQKFLASIVAGVPPYGTLAFELWAAHSRRRPQLHSDTQMLVRAIIKQGENVLAIQPSKGVDWLLPGGTVKANETTTEALARHLLDKTGLSLKSYSLRNEITNPLTGQSELYFDATFINNKAPGNFKNVIKRNPAIDDIRFIKLANLSAFELPDI